MGEPSHNPIGIFPGMESKLSLGVQIFRYPFLVKLIIIVWKMPKKRYSHRLDSDILKKNEHKIVKL